MNADTKNLVEAAMKLRPDTYQTHWQHHVECAVAAADKAVAGLDVTSVYDEVPEPVRVATIALAYLMAWTVDKPECILMPDDASGNSDAGNSAMGVRLERDDLGHMIVLRTHQPVGVHPLLEEASSMNDVLTDGYGPSPVSFMSAGRFRAAYRGLLRMLEQELVDLEKGDDYNWDEDWDEGWDENWHPNEMLGRVRDYLAMAAAHQLVEAVNVN